MWCGAGASEINGAALYRKILEIFLFFIQIRFRSKLIVAQLLANNFLFRLCHFLVLAVLQNF